MAASVACLLGVMLAPASAFALPDDRNQPIYIKSDRAERDDRRGTTTYTGDVVIDQGTLHIAADRVVITMQGDRVVTMEATGKPAKMNQKTSPDKEPVFARGLAIQYDVVQDILTLIEQAEVTQEGSTLTGKRIDYFMREQRAKATSGDSPGADSRVHMVIQPKHSASATGNPPPPQTEPPSQAEQQPPSPPTETPYGAP